MKTQKKRAVIPVTTLLENNHENNTPVLKPTLAQVQHQNHQHSPVLRSVESQSSQTNLGSSVVTPSGFNRCGNKILAVGQDTLELTIGGMVSPSQYYLDNVALWAELKSSYVSPDKYFTIQIGDRWFELYPKSSGQYSFLLRNDEFGFIKLFHPDDFSSGAINKQQIHLKLYSCFLHSVTDEELIKEIYSITSFFVEDYMNVALLISRIDLHVDISNGNSFFSKNDIDNVITRTRFRDKWYNQSGVSFTEREIEFMESFSDTPSYNRGCGKLKDLDLLQDQDFVKRMMLVSLHQNSYGADRLIGGRELQTAYFGNPKVSDVYAKIYDKTEEIKKKPNDLIKDIWVSNGYNNVDKVVRTEMSMKRAFLKELNNGVYVNLIDFLNNKHIVWQYMTHKFIRMVVEKKDNNTQLSEVTEFWQLVQNAYQVPVVSLTRKKNYNGRIDQLWSQGVGCIKQMIAVGMNSNDDAYFAGSVTDALKQVLISSYHKNEYYERRKHLGIA